MVRNLSHSDWVLQQFENRYLKSSYRNVLIHASIIEGALRNASKESKFDKANKSLLISKEITSSEFRVFNAIREIRNSLVHDSFKNGLEQNKIDALRDGLMNKIQEAYRISDFLNEQLIKKYKIIRPSNIKFIPLT